MDKREMIERALDSTYRETLAFIPHSIAESWDYFLDTLADQAIVIECEVEQVSDSEIPPNKYTVTSLRNMFIHPVTLSLRGHHGTPGKALSIILSLEE